MSLAAAVRTPLQAQTFRVEKYNIGGTGGHDYITIDPVSSDILGSAVLEDNAPEGAASDGKGKLYVNNEGKNTIQVLDAASMKLLASWPIDACDGPTGIALDRPTMRIFSGCGKRSVVIDANNGKVVAELANGDGVDALGYDPSEKLMYIPAGRDGNVTVVKQNGPDKYTVVMTVPTMTNAKTISVDPVKHVAYALALEFNPSPTGETAPAGGRNTIRRPLLGAWLFVISH